MKESKYNYYFTLDGNKDVIFNGRTKRFFRVSNKNSSRFRDILKNPDLYFEQYKPFLLRMQDEGFVLCDDVDEYALVQDLYKQALRPNSCKLLILPTYQCNVRCWYCTQKHQDMRMDTDTLSRLKKHIENILKKHKEINELYISWFGGEPMLEYDIIVDVTSFAKELCKRRKVAFLSGITTNGLLLDKEKIQKFRDLSIYHYQITIDGFRDQHNKVKQPYVGSAFDITVNNIKSIAELVPEASVNLRVNYTAKTNPDRIIEEVNSIIPNRLRKCITITPRKVWQIDNAQIPQETLNKLRGMGKNSSYNYDGCAMGLCYVEGVYFETIYSDGHVGKCDNDDMYDAKGMLTDDGDVQWNSEYLFAQKSVLDSKSQCSTCKYLPICWGPCPRRREEMIEAGNEITCTVPNIENDAKEYILNYIASLT